MRAPTIACIGGAHIDRHAALHRASAPATSNPVSVSTDFGGVARNVAANLTRLGCRVLLCSRVGDDEAGRQVVSQSLDTSLVTVSDRHPTASYTAILEPDGELVIGLADMDVYEELTPAVVEPGLSRLREASLWFLDTNPPAATIEWLLSAAGEIPVAVDAVSVAKAERLRGKLPAIGRLFCNLAQAEVLTGTAVNDAAAAATGLWGAGSPRGIVSAGADGVAVYDGTDVRLMPAIAARPRDVTGAGDALVSGVLYGLSQGLDLFAAARLGLAAAAITVESENSTAPALSPEALHARA